MAEADRLQRQLINAQNPDGGWAYERGSSWTEPTALALLALEAHGFTDTAYQRGCLWLERTQRFDGGWPPQPLVDVSTWVTSLAALVFSGQATRRNQHGRSIRWLLGETKPETSPIARLVYRLRGAIPPIHAAGGSPWFPGTAAWIAPTATSVLALQQAAHSHADPLLASCARDGQQYILCRRCRDGGWDHGGGRYLSENARSYPEMTGIALLALYGVAPAELVVPLKLAEAHLASAESMEALCWLHLALVRHGCGTKSIETSLPCRNLRDVSLRLLSLAAGSSTNKLMIAV